MYRSRRFAIHFKSNTRSLAILIKLSALLLAGALLTACDFQAEPTTLERIRQQRTLVVLTRNAPTTYYRGRDDWEGFEHDLIVEFANHLNVTPRFVIYNNVSEILDAIAQGKGDVAAAGITLTQERSRNYRFSPTYQEVEQQVVCRRGGKIPTNLIELTKVKLAVVAGTSFEARLIELKALIPQLTWTTESELSAEQMLIKVWNHELDCTVVDSNIVAVNRRYYPELVVGFPISGIEHLAWVVPSNAGGLQRELRDWFARQTEDGELDAIYERYYGHVEPSYDYVDNRVFLSRIAERLGKFENLFKRAGEKYHIPWHLLAAQAYQESHWEPNAKAGPVGGLMMIAQNTARELKIKDRFNPEQSIMGGAWYLNEMRSRLPEAITDPDRTWIALAAYNVGLAHVLDAIELAGELDRNPASWKELREILPLLANGRYFGKLRFGYARGGIPVRYVQRIRHYYDILSNYENIQATMEENRLPPLAPDEQEPSLPLTTEQDATTG